jgi:GR25 family glycosyltransferase involved in LPS biosynthesis
MNTVTISTDSIFKIKTYVIHSPKLSTRYDLVLKQLTLHKFGKVTFVECADRKDIEELSTYDFNCLHPWQENTRYKYNTKQMPRGKVSPHSKHRIAWQDMVSKNISKALILEDDVILINNFQSLATNLLRIAPPKVEIMLFGSYSNARAYGTLNNAPLYKENMHCIYNNTNRVLFGTVSYVIWRKKASRLINHPITSPSDVEVTYRDYTNSRKFICGPSQWIAWPNKSLPGGTHG